VPAPLSVAATKAMIYETAGLEPKAALARALCPFQACSKANDAMEGMRAFREKRPPQWKGR